MDSYWESRYKASAWFAMIIAPLLIVVGIILSPTASAYETNGKASFNIEQLVEVSNVLDNKIGVTLLDVDGDIGFIKYGEDYGVITVNAETPAFDEYADDAAIKMQWTISLPGRVEVGWYGINDRYTDFYIYRNDKLIGQVKDGNSFTDTKPLKGVEAEYRVEASSIIPEKEWAELLTDEEIKATLQGELDKPTRGHAFGYPTLSSVENNYKSVEEQYAVQVTATGATYTQIRYAAFIRDAWVPLDFMMSIGCPLPSIVLPVGAKIYFKGDNRSWYSYTGATAVGHRVQLVVRKDWGTNAQPFIVGKSIGPTKVYYGFPPSNMTYFSSQTASASGVTLTTTANSVTSAGVKMKLVAGNPWCMGATPIDGELQVGFTQSGVYSYSATLRRVPDHEAYIKWNTGVTKKLIQTTNVGFDCLNPLYTNTLSKCKKTTFSGSGNG